MEEDYNEEQFKTDLFDIAIELKDIDKLLTDKKDIIVKREET